MLLVSPEVLLGVKWIRSFWTNDQLAKDIGISKRTMARVWASGPSVSKKTRDVLWAQAQNAFVNVGVVLPDTFPPDIKGRPWGSLLLPLLQQRAGEMDGLEYPLRVILQIEEAQRDILDMPRMRMDIGEFLEKSGLPDSIIDEAFYANLFEWANKVKMHRDRALPRGYEKATLGVYLFIVAAFEVALLGDSSLIGNREPFVHRCLPRFEGDKYVYPMNSWINEIKLKFRLKADKELAQHIEVSTRKATEEEDSHILHAVRIIRYWKSGEGYPSPETVKGVALKLCDMNRACMRGFIISYVLRRLTQELHMDIRNMIESGGSVFRDERELVEFFGLYSGWRDWHEELYRKRKIAGHTSVPR